MNMHSQQARELIALLERLQEIGEKESFLEMNDIPGLDSAGLLDEFLWEHTTFIKIYSEKLPVKNRESLIKSLAIFEDRVGGRGSVSILNYLIERFSERDREILGWVLSHTRCYYYSSARSLEEYDEENARKWAETLKNIRREEGQQELFRIQRSAKATGSIFDAVRRRDRIAVSALIAKGANVNAKTAEGRRLIDLALERGDSAILSELRNAGALE